MLRRGRRRQGAGLLVFVDASWAHLLGMACLVVCAVSVFRLSATG
jgi:hypothetical protein